MPEAETTSTRRHPSAEVRRGPTGYFSSTDPKGTVAIALDRKMLEAIEKFQHINLCRGLDLTRTSAIRVLIGLGIHAASDDIEASDALRAAATKHTAREPLALPPPPATEPAAPPTLSDLAALIRTTAEANPFVRPLADFIEGRI